jgi:hypothetical protein
MFDVYDPAMAELQVGWGPEAVGCARMPASPLSVLDANSLHLWSNTHDAFSAKACSVSLMRPPSSCSSPTWSSASSDISFTPTPGTPVLGGSYAHMFDQQPHHHHHHAHHQSRPGSAGHPALRQPRGAMPTMQDAKQHKQWDQTTSAPKRAQQQSRLTNNSKPAPLDPSQRVSWTSKPPQTLMLLLGASLFHSRLGTDAPTGAQWAHFAQSLVRCTTAGALQAALSAFFEGLTLDTIAEHPQLALPRDPFSPTPLESPRSDVALPTDASMLLQATLDLGSSYLRDLTCHLPLDSGLWDVLQQLAISGQLSLVHTVIENCLKWEDPSGLVSRSSKPVANVRGYLYRKLKQKIEMLQHRPDVLELMRVLRQEEPFVAENVDGHTLQFISDHVRPRLNEVGAVQVNNEEVLGCAVELHHAAAAGWLQTGWGNVKVLVFSVVKSYISNVQEMEQLLGPL